MCVCVCVRFPWCMTEHQAKWMNKNETNRRFFHTSTVGNNMRRRMNLSQRNCSQQKNLRRKRTNHRRRRHRRRIVQWFTRNGRERNSRHGSENTIFVYVQYIKDVCRWCVYVRKRMSVLRSVSGIVNWYLADWKYYGKMENGAERIEMMGDETMESQSANIEKKNAYTPECHKVAVCWNKDFLLGILVHSLVSRVVVLASPPLVSLSLRAFSFRFIDKRWWLIVCPHSIRPFRQFLRAL